MRIATHTLGLLLLPMLGLLACAEQGDQASEGMEMEMGFDMAAAEAVVAELQAQWVKGIENDDAASVAALYAEDATVHPPNGEMVTGRAAIEEFWGAFIAEEAEDNTLNTIEVGGHGDVIYEVGVYRGTVGGEMDRGKYLVILKRGADGSWKIHHDIFNSDLPAE